MAKKQSLLGLLYLAAAALSAYLLIWQGSWAMIAALFGTAIQNMAPPDQPSAVNLTGLALFGAFMASAGGCVTLGMFIVGTRAFAGKPFPRWTTARIFLILFLFLVGMSVAFVGLATGLASHKAGYQGLGGIWHPVNSDKHTYRFNPDGTLDSWWSNLPHGRMGRWTRTGDTVTVIYDRNWQFAGTVRQGSIKGTMTETSSGKPLGAEEWVRDGGP